MTAARLDALLAGWKGSRGENAHGSPSGLLTTSSPPTEPRSRQSPQPPRPSSARRGIDDETAAAEAPAPAAAAPPLKVSLVSEVAAREELREHLRGLPGVEASQLDNLSPVGRRRGADEQTGPRRLYLARRRGIHVRLPRRLAACRLAPVERQLRAEAERLRVENDALRATRRRPRGARPSSGPSSGGSAWRTELAGCAAAPVVVNHSRRDAGLGAWMAETFDHAVGTEPVVVNQVRPARRVTAGAPVVPPAPAGPAWPAPMKRPIPPLGPRAASLAADNGPRRVGVGATQFERFPPRRRDAGGLGLPGPHEAAGRAPGPEGRLATRRRLGDAARRAHHVGAAFFLDARRGLAPGAAVRDERRRGRRRPTGRGRCAPISGPAAAALGTSRTAGAVESRWKALRAGTGARTRPWTSNEDERLRTMVGDLGASSDWRAMLRGWATAGRREASRRAGGA